MNLVKTAGLNGLAVLLRVTAALGVNKLLAIYVGPSGFLLIGQLQSVFALANGVASNAISTGVTKLTAQHGSEPDRQLEIWRCALTVGLILSGLAALVIVTASSVLSLELLNSTHYRSVFFWLAGALPAIVVHGILLAALNGKQLIRSFVIANIASSLVAAATAGLLVLLFGLYGALVSLAVGQALSLATTMLIVARLRLMPWRSLISGPKFAHLGSLAKLASMTVIAAVAMPLAHIYIRNSIALTNGVSAAGLWQAMFRISDLHLMLITTTLVAYFLPRFSELSDHTALRKEVRKAITFVAPLSVVTSSLLFASKGFLVPALLTAEFSPVEAALGWQLAGDTLKICSWICAYTMIGRGQIRSYISVELLFTCVLAALISIGAAFAGLEGAAKGYALTYLAYGVCTTSVFLLTTRRHVKRLTK